MVGIFDSGMGGVAALNFFKKLAPDTDVVFFADKENAPYGTKSESELIPLVINDIDKLRKFGAEKILIACCTASAVYEQLGKEHKCGVIPIIDPVARVACAVSRTGRIGIISTEATMRSGGFVKAIKRELPSANTVSASSRILVTLAERGAKDENLTSSERSVIAKELLPLLSAEVDTVVLGCTHFSYFRETVEDILGIPAVDSAEIGAEVLNEKIKPYPVGEGRTIYI